MSSVRSTLSAASEISKLSWFESQAPSAAMRTLNPIFKARPLWWRGGFVEVWTVWFIGLIGLEFCITATCKNRSSCYKKVIKTDSCGLLSAHFDVCKSHLRSEVRKHRPVYTSINLVPSIARFLVKTFDITCLTKKKIFFILTLKKFVTSWANMMSHLA